MWSAKIGIKFEICITNNTIFSSAKKYKKFIDEWMKRIEKSRDELLKIQSHENEF